MDAHPRPATGPAPVGPASADALAAPGGADTPAGTTPADALAARTAASTIDRTWELRRRAERRAGWQRPALGSLVTAGFVVIADPDLLPGGTPVALAALGVVIAVFVISAVLSFRRASVRGHSGNVRHLAHPGRPWWRSPALAGPAAYTAIFLGGITGAFDHWPVIIACAIAVGIGVALAVPRYETADHVHGARLEHVPELTASGEAAAADGDGEGEGDPAPDVLELLVLQHHTGERRISWCADVLGTDPADIRHRIARGRRWLELPATEVHDPATAGWVRLSANGREALGYV